MKTCRAAAVLWVLGLAGPARAQDWWPVDSQSRSMGNTGVALSEGAGSAYINPANLALGLDKGASYSLSGASPGAYLFAELAVEEETITFVDQLADLYTTYSTAQTALNTAGGADAAAIQQALQIVDTLTRLNEEGHGMNAAVGGGIDLKFGSFGIFARQLGFAGADPFSDFAFLNASAFSNLVQSEFFGQFASAAPTTPEGAALAAQLASIFPGDADGDGVLDADELAYQAELAVGGAGVGDPAFQQALIQVAQNTQANAGGSDLLTLLYNGSGVEIRSVLLRETGISAGFALPIFPALSSIRVGVTVKEIIAETFVTRITANTVEDGDAIYDQLRHEFDENRTRQNEFNMDLGLAVSPIPWLTIGVSARNLIPMEFEFEQPSLVDKYHMDTQYKLGIGFSPVGIFRAGVELDLRRLDLDQVEGLEQQLLAGGVELSLAAFKIRGGAFGNLGAPDPKPVYTLGVGLNLGVFTLDIVGQTSLTRVQIEQSSMINGSDNMYVPTHVSLGVTLGFNINF